MCILAVLNDIPCTDSVYHHLHSSVTMQIETSIIKKQQVYVYTAVNTTPLLLQGDDVSNKPTQSNNAAAILCWKNSPPRFVLLRGMNHRSV